MHQMKQTGFKLSSLRNALPSNSSFARAVMVGPAKSKLTYIVPFCRGEGAPKPVKYLGKVKLKRS